MARYIDDGVGLVEANPSVKAEARLRVLRRAATSDFLEGAFLQRRSRWGRVPPRPSKGHSMPVIEADEVEVVVVQMLALTRPEMQFAVRRGSDRIFAGHMNGYHHEDEGVPLSGLSEIVDSVDLLVRAHRGAEGGRVYIQNSIVTCAKHSDVLARVVQRAC